MGIREYEILIFDSEFWDRSILIKAALCGCEILIQLQIGALSRRKNLIAWLNWPFEWKDSSIKRYETDWGSVWRYE